jgi:hypothetical protein
MNNVAPVQGASNCGKRVDPSVERDRQAISFAEIVIEISDWSWLPSAGAVLVGQQGHVADKQSIFAAEDTVCSLAGQAKTLSDLCHDISVPLAPLRPGSA